MDGDGFDIALSNDTASCSRHRIAPAIRVLSALALAFVAHGVAFAGEVQVESDAAVASAALPASPVEPDSPAALQRWSTSSEFSSGNYRWSLSRGSLDLGLRFDTPGRVRSVTPLPLDASGPFVQTLPTIRLGLRSVEAAPGASWLRQLAGGDAASGLAHRIGIEWKPAESQLMFVRDGLGMRLGGDDRLTMRLRKGTLGIYMNRQF